MHLNRLSKFVLAAALLLLLPLAGWAQALPRPTWHALPPSDAKPSAYDPAASVKAFFSDPTGDTLPGAGGTLIDITGISADVVGSSLIITVSFAGSIAPADAGANNSVVGFIDLDTDGNTAETANFGNDPTTHYCASQPYSMGSDYFLALFGGSTSSTPIGSFDTDTAVGSAPTSYSNSSVTFTVPLSAIGAGTAPIKVGMVLGNFDFPTDCAGAVTAAAVSQGPPVTVTGTAQAGSTMTFRSPVAGVRYDWDFDGDGVFDRTGSSNSLNVIYPAGYSGNVAVLTTNANGGRTISNMTINAAAPRLTAALNGSSAQLCGDGDSQPEPGESWNVPVRITNSGNATASAASAAFVAQDRLNAATSGSAIDGKLIVQTPLIDVGTLAPGASMTANVTVTLDGTAACGSSLGLLFNGGVDGASSSSGSGTALSTFNIPSTCQRYTGTCSQLPATAKAIVTPRQGLYYNPNRPGNGLSNFIIPQGTASPVYFGAWFTAAADHTPTWYVIQGSLVGNVVVGPIYRFTRNLGSATFAVNSAVVGQAIVTMKGTEQIAFFWQIGSKSGIELMSYFTAGASPSPNRTGAWYNTAEAGWGQVVHQFISGGQSSVFVVDYLYDGAGEPRWVLGQGTVAEFGSSVSHQTYQVHCPGCPYIADWNSFPLQSGNANDVFLDSINGRTTTFFNFPAPLAGAWTRNNLPISLLTVPQ